MSDRPCGEKTCPNRTEFLFCNDCVLAMARGEFPARQIPNEPPPPIRDDYFEPPLEREFSDLWEGDPNDDRADFPERHGLI